MIKKLYYCLSSFFCCVAMVSFATELIGTFRGHPPSTWDLRSALFIAVLASLGYSLDQLLKLVKSL